MDLTEASGATQIGLGLFWLGALVSGLSCIDSLRKRRPVDPAIIPVVFLALAGVGNVLISGPWWAEAGMTLFVFVGVIISLQVAGMRGRKGRGRRPPGGPGSRTENG